MYERLQELIYGMEGVIVVTAPTTRGIVEEIEEVKSGFTKSGNIFRPAFASEVVLSDYTHKDWIAMLAQYAISYGWEEDFDELTPFSARGIIRDYKGHAVSTVNIIQDDLKPFKVKTKAYFLEFITGILKSPKVLRQNQIDCLDVCPIAILEQAYQSTHIQIKETKAIVQYLLFSAGSEIKVFEDLNEITRLICKSVDVDGQITKESLKPVKFNVTTSSRKNILRIIDGLEVNQKLLDELKRYTQWYKRLFKQLSWTSLEKMAKRYPNAMEIRSLLYRGPIRTRRTLIHKYLNNGDYQSAFIIECENIGSLLRNILMYCRYPAGQVVASKTNPNSSNVVVFDAGEKKAQEAFSKALGFASKKLMQQTIMLLLDDAYYKSIETRSVYKTTVAYKTPLPPLDTEIAVKMINALRGTLRESNGDLQQTYYFDESCKNYTLPFSGREDASTSLSGEYLGTGSRIPIPDLEGNELLRMGVMWRSKISTDLDLSMSIDDGQTCYFGEPVYPYQKYGEEKPEVLITSSGDITRCDETNFSTELVDCDIEGLKEQGIKSMYSSLTSYFGENLDSPDMEAYWFIQVIDKNDRILKGTKVQINLDETMYAIRLNIPAKAALGIQVDLEHGYLKVLNTAVPKVPLHSSAVNGRFQLILDALPPTLSVYEALQRALPLDKVVAKEDADVIISADSDSTIHPGKDISTLLPIVF